MTNKKRTSMRKYAQEALKARYGFAPAQKDISLLYCHFKEDEECRPVIPQFVAFAVNGKAYAYDGITLVERHDLDVTELYEW